MTMRLPRVADQSAPQTILILKSRRCETLRVTDPLKFWQTVTAQNMGASLRAEWHENVPNTV
jgi:hypothetical protein